MLMGIGQFERLFREAASIDIDKSDIKRLNDFVNQRLYDLLLLAQAAARANGRDIMEFWDVPITKGLQENIHEFKELDEILEVEPILEAIAQMPLLELGYSAELEEQIPYIVGGITISLAKVFRVIDPEIKNPDTGHWETVEAIYEILL